MDEFDNAAHNMAALTATIALYRALVRKGLMPRDEAMQILLDEAIANERAGTTDLVRDVTVTGVEGTWASA